MKDLFEGIAYLFEDILFVPLDWMRELQDSSWALANIFSWIFIIIGFVAFLYWMKQLQIYNQQGNEDRTQTAHSFLK